MKLNLWSKLKGWSECVMSKMSQRNILQNIYALGQCLLTTFQCQVGRTYFCSAYCVSEWSSGDVLME